MCIFHSILECCVTFSGVKLSIRSFVLFIIIIALLGSRVTAVFLSNLIFPNLEIL